ncbi:MAG: hypothetical protein FWE25_03655 [Lachnospiraceae bacterium]|nr:hypothetical protein [Lachnospiraceae bacterium]
MAKKKKIVYIALSCILVVLIVVAVINGIRVIGNRSANQGSVPEPEIVIQVVGPTATEDFVAPLEIVSIFEEDEEDSDLEEEEEESDTFTVVLPAGYFEEFSDEERAAMIEQFPGLEVIVNEDGTITYVMSAEIRVLFLEQQREQVEGLIAMMLGEHYPFIAELNYNEDFSEIEIVTTVNLFETEQNTFLDIMGIVILGYTAPIYQFYLGADADATTRVTLINQEDGEVYRIFYGPHDFFNWEIE